MDARAQQVLDFWFGGDSNDVDALQGRVRVWFGNDAAQVEAFDEEIRHGFGADVEAALRGELESWKQPAHARLALVILLDQFPRNMYRGSARAFAGDARALALVQEGLKSGADRVLTGVQRMFFYMPLQHAEDAAAQTRGLEEFRRLAADAPPELRAVFESSVNYARQHHDIIVRFGRFPHRNAALGRDSTVAEREFLASGATDFGQSRPKAR